MADTIRTLAALQTILADNTSNAITPQNVRDFLVSTNDWARRGCDGRLTLASGGPIPTSDLIGQSVVYWTPYNGDHICLWNGSFWDLYSSAELSVTLSGLTSGKNYDVFAYVASGTLKIDLGPTWNSGTAGSDTARGTGAGSTELQIKNGIWTNKNSVTTAVHGDTISANQGTYLGTIRSTGTGTTQDSVLKRFVWNNFNRVFRKLLVTDTTSTWTYASASFRQVRAQAGNMVEAVVGLTGDVIELFATEYSDSKATTYGTTGIGVNWSSGASSNDIESVGAYISASTASVQGAPTAHLLSPASLGYSSYTWLECAPGAATTTFYSDASPGAGNGIAGMIGGCFA